MKNSVVRMFMMLLVLGLALSACKGKENAAAGEATATIERAKPLPDQTPAEAMTQTVSVEEDNRSEAEGGVLTADPSVATPGMTSTTGPATTTTTGSPTPPGTTTSRTTTR